MATQQEILYNLYSAFYKKESADRENERIDRIVRKKADESEAGKNYYKALDKYKKTISKYNILKNIIRTSAIVLALLSVLTVVFIVGYNITFNNLQQIRQPVKEGNPDIDPVWGREQYVILYTLGFFMAICLIECGCVLGFYKVKGEDNSLFLLILYLVIACCAYVGISIYTIINGEGGNKVLGPLMPLMLPVAFLIMLPFNCGGIGDDVLAMMPTIGAFVLVTVTLGVVAYFIRKVILLAFNNVKLGKEKINKLKQETDLLYKDYRKTYEKIDRSYNHERIDTYEINSYITELSNKLELGSENRNLKTVGKILWCIENNYANDIVSAQNWVYNDANRKRAEAENKEFHNTVVKQLDSIKESIDNISINVEVENNIEITNKTDIRFY